ncbi:hypothetical protein M5K25_001192 [Dendrobium thyrsiflorum]|uniref:Uncharacterized protein n=1 Tax=Dendrobium thyrsiflorum TaxID=117978 RepID=A0ABD0VPG7_DENTH
MSPCFLEEFSISANTILFVRLPAAKAERKGLEKTVKQLGGVSLGIVVAMIVAVIANKNQSGSRSRGELILFRTSVAFALVSLSHSSNIRPAQENRKKYSKRKYYYRYFLHSNRHPAPRPERHGVARSHNQCAATVGSEDDEKGDIF